MVDESCELCASGRGHRTRLDDMSSAAPPRYDMTARDLGPVLPFGKLKAHRLCYDQFQLEERQT